ncbi:MAG: TolC family protein, partial [Verrucomicrobiota bacterium]|nr:TolC family protein [Verrucomicrobiota bacterium]
MHSLHGVESFIRVDPESAVTRALVSNKHLRAAELEIKRARVQLHWEGRLNNPELEISSSSDVLGNGEGESVFEVAFAQQFPLTSKLRKARNLRQVQLGLAEAEVNDQRRDLANKVRTACIMIATAQQKKELYTKQSKLNEEIADFLDSAAERGEASVLDSTKARLAAKVFKQKTNAASSEIERWLGELRDLLSLSSESGLIVSADLQLPAESPSRKIDIKSALSRRPDYQVALIKTNLARAELS